MAGRDLLPLLPSLPADRLVDLVLDLVRGDRTLERRVRLALPPADAGLAVLRAEVDEVLRSRRSLGYRATTEYAEEAQAVVAALDRAADGPAEAEVVPVVERALGHVIKLLLRGDDSAGAVGDVAVHLLEVHVRAVQHGHPDPARLVRWLVRFTFDDQDFFQPHVRGYASVLGETGLTAYRDQVHRRVEADPAASGGLYALQQLALLDRDPEAIVRLFGRGLESVHGYRAVAQAFREIGEADQALDWALRTCDRAAAGSPGRRSTWRLSCCPSGMRTWWTCACAGCARCPTWSPTPPCATQRRRSGRGRSYGPRRSSCSATGPPRSTSRRCCRTGTSRSPGRCCGRRRQLVCRGS